MIYSILCIHTYDLQIVVNVQNIGAWPTFSTASAPERDVSALQRPWLLSKPFHACHQDDFYKRNAMQRNCSSESVATNSTPPASATLWASSGP